MQESPVDVETYSSLTDSRARSVLDATSLRAAALLTLKSKRHKISTDHGSCSFHSLRPLSRQVGSIQLDYGEDESCLTSVPASDRSSNSNLLMQTREEGEISDEDSGKLHNNIKPNSCTASSLSFATNFLEFSARPRPYPKSESLPLQNSFIRSNTFSPKSAPSSTSDTRTLENASSFVQPEHVRPGIALSQSQYDTAKDLILDLLGWGVHPEYLVECGLTRQIVFFVFHELNLRLPRNLDTTGLVPYKPCTRSSSLSRSSLSLPSSSPRQACSPPNNSPDSSLDVAKPPQPLDVLGTYISTTDVLETPRIFSSNSLHDMELQRKQELLARKAAIASRKARQSSQCTSPTVPDLAALSQSPPLMNISTEYNEDILPITGTVDDFLNSIDQDPGDPGDSTYIDTQIALDNSNIRVCETVVDDLTKAGPTFAAAQETISVSDLIEQLPAEDAITTRPECQHPGSTTSSTSLTRASSRETSGLRQDKQRKRKRPVAVDFDDFDTSLHLSESSAPSQQSLKRRNMPMFANVNQRRCIIDLSDSEGEEDISSNPHNESPAPRPGENKKKSNGRSTPPISTASPDLGPNVNTPSGTMTPAVLMQKEKEIQKMKELIALMEQSRSNKLGKNLPNIDLVNKACEDHGYSNSLRPRSHLCMGESVELCASAPSNENDLRDPGKFETAEPVIQEGICQTSAARASMSMSETTTNCDVVNADVAASSSTQMNSSLSLLEEHQNRRRHQEQSVVRNMTYESPFRLYPRLALLSMARSAKDCGPFSLQTTAAPLSPAAHRSSPVPLPDFRSLKFAVASKSWDPSKRICQYELPGGGICRDETCEDVHMSRILDWNEVEPDDPETAEYLLKTLPMSWIYQTGASLSTLTVALERARVENSQTTFEERVGRAIASFQAL